MERRLDKTEKSMKRNALGFSTFLALSLTTAVAFAGDVERGRHIVQDRCAACHIVGRGLRGIVADSPPFEVIGRKYGFNEDSLVAALVSPHAKMNFTVRGRDADDIAAYIAALAR
jgi:mono/diheme cytochrome c family protein